MLSRWRIVTSSFSSEKVYRFFLVTWYAVVSGIPYVVFILKRGRNVYILKMKGKRELMSRLEYNISENCWVVSDNFQSLRVLSVVSEKYEKDLGRELACNLTVRSKHSRMSRTKSGRARDLSRYRAAGKVRREQFGPLGRAKRSRKWGGGGGRQILWRQLSQKRNRVR